MTASGIAIALALVGCSGGGAGKPQPSTRSAPTSAATSSSDKPITPPPPRDAAFLDAQAVQSALDDASRDIVAANTYDYRHLTEFRRTALAATTGTFTQTLAQTIDGLIAEKAPKVHARQVAKVSRIGIVTMHGEDGTVLIFGQLTVRNDTYPTGRTDPFDAVADIQRVQQRWLLTRLAIDGTASCDPPGTAALTAACTTAGEGAVAITTFRRSTFNRDFRHATSLATGPLLADLRSQKQSTLHTMLNGGFDLHSRVVATAVGSAKPDKVEVLVTLDGYKSTSHTPSPQHLVVTVEKIAGRWLLSGVIALGVS